MNEPDPWLYHLHVVDPITYTGIYDAVVTELKQIDPEMKFSGLALQDTAALNWFEYFLNAKNHKPGIPLDMVSFHRYIVAQMDKYPSRWEEEMFEDADELANTIVKIVKIRDRLSPNTKLFLSELGIMDAGIMLRADVKEVPEAYWQPAAAVWAYAYLGAIKAGIDLVAAAELVNYPGMFAGTNLIHWETGEPNAVYHVAKLLHDRLRQGDQFVETRIGSEQVVAQALSGPRGGTLLLINKSRESQRVSLPVSGNATMFIVSRENGDGRKGVLISGTEISLDAHAVAVVQGLLSQ
jgi:hypothetical protein